MLRSAGEVGCAHCAKMGADRACLVCTRYVCDKCAADWASCAEPSGRVVRLGMTARVRDIDPLCRYALVAHWRKPLRLFDLRALHWVPNIRWERSIYLFHRSVRPRLRTRELIWPEITGETGELTFAGMRARDIETGQGRELVRTPRFGAVDDIPDHGTAVSATGDLFYYVSDSQRVIVLPPDGAAASYEPLPRKVVQAVSIDAERSLLASASWSEIALHHVEAGALRRTSHVKIKREADVRWIGVGGSRVVVVTSSWHATFVEVYAIAADLSLRSDPVTFTIDATFDVAALSRDGRYFAIAAFRKLLVCDLTDSTRQVFTDHTDQINAIRFAADDHVLVSADTDHRIVLRPRTSSGYAWPLLAVEVPA